MLQPTESHQTLLLKVGLAMPSSSNPVAPTSKKADSIKISGILLPLSATGPVERVRYKRKPEISRAGFPFHRARLHPSDMDMRKPWYIVFYAWDITTERLVRKRVLKEEFKPLPFRDRTRFAARMIEEINYFLERGAHIESEQQPKAERFNFSSYSLLDAIEYARQQKVTVEEIRESTSDEYVSTITTVREFLQHAALPSGYKLRHVDHSFLVRYFDYLKQVRGVSNKTYNNRRMMLRAAFQVLIGRDPKLFGGVNPVDKIKMLKTDTRKHAAYTDQQMQAIAESCYRRGQPHLVLFMQFVFYTLARPDEVRMLKVGHIRMPERRILFLAENAKTRIEEFVGIPDQLADIIERSGILAAPPEHYIFSTEPGHGPGPVVVSHSYFYKRIRPHILRLGYYKINPNYTLYSFKHSGAISLYKATRDIKLLQAQCRHKTLEQTNRYLRDLGLFQDFDQLNKWKGPI